MCFLNFQKIRFRYRNFRHTKRTGLNFNKISERLVSDVTEMVRLREDLVAQWRPHLPPRVLTSPDVTNLPDGEEVTVAGLIIRRQRPLGIAVFLTLEDEFGHIPIIVWPKIYQRYRMVLREPVVVVCGEVSRRDGTMNIVAKHAGNISGARHLPTAKNWQ